jgi:hypothetical protein
MFLVDRLHKPLVNGAEGPHSKNYWLRVAQMFSNNYSNNYPNNYPNNYSNNYSKTVSLHVL